LVTVYNLQTENLITNVMIQEQFTPLVGLNFAWKNGITTTVDFKRSRSLALNIGAMQLAEARNTELAINLSYRKDGLLPSFSLFGKERQLKNTITFRFETTVRSIRMANRKLDSLEPPLPTGGNLNLVLKPGIDYQISTQITARAYVEHNRNTPVISTSFPTSFTAIGVQIQFNLTSL
jgi:cell surface protein SprA